MNRNLTCLLALALVATLTAASARAQGEKGAKTIVEIAAGDKNFSKLVAAVKAAALVETLASEGPFTVFAPTDKAFEALGEDTLKQVLADKEKLKTFLTYHVVKGKVVADEALVLAKYKKSVTTVNGAEIKLSLENKKLTLNGNTTVIQADVMARNGVIHVIDKVLLPPGDKGSGKVAEARNGKSAKLCVPVSEPAAYSLALRFNATQKEKERLVALFKEAAEQTPPKGDKAAWKKRNEGIAEAAKELAADMDPRKIQAARIKFSLRVDCFGCHREHKESVFTGIPDWRLGRIPNDVPAEFRRMEFPRGDFPRLEFPKIEFPKIEFPKMEVPKGNFGFPNPEVPAAGETNELGKALGAALRVPGATLAEQLELPSGKGIVVGAVVPESAAAKAGLKQHDILLELNGKPVSSNLDELTRQAGEIRPNTPVDVVVLRKGRRETVRGLMLPETRPLGGR